jgi:hypothetical protein
MEQDGFRLPTGLMVGAVMRKLTAAGQGAYILQKGDAERGTLLVKLVGRDGSCRLELQQRDLDARLVWMSAFREADVTEAKSDEYITRARARDPDLWIVEIEVADSASPNPFAEEL